MVRISTMSAVTSPRPPRPERSRATGLPKRPPGSASWRTRPWRKRWPDRHRVCRTNPLEGSKVMSDVLQDAHAVLFPVLLDVALDDNIRRFLDSGGRSLLFGENGG